MRSQLATRRFGLAGVGLAAVAAAAALVSCGGGGGGDSPPDATAATIDSTSMASAVASLDGFISVCNPGARPTAIGGSPTVKKALGVLARQKLLRSGQAPDMRRQAYTATPPADQFGDCGGKLSHVNYSHSNGVTTATLRFADYCEEDSDTGERQVINGDLDFVNTATPTSSGPITTQWRGSSSGLSAVARTSGGTVIGSQTTSFSSLTFTVGVPGGVPTAANPDRIGFDELTVTDQLSGKAHRQTGYRVTMFDADDGGTRISVSGRGHRADGSYFDITTPTPIAIDGDGAYTGGVLTFTGAPDNVATMTIVPGTTLQATVSVNGKPLDSLPVCTP